MASWKDGPEYAPLERPNAFSAPEVAPLGRPDPAPAPPAVPPAPPRSFEPPLQPGPPLRELVPAEATRRDPAQPFAVVTSVMTASPEALGGSAWGSAHSTQTAPTQTTPAPGWAPDQAYASTYAPPPPAQGFPAPGTPAWFGPGTAPAPGRPVPLTAGTVIQATTWGVLISLLLGGVITLISPVLLLVAFLLTSQARYRRRHVRAAFYAAMGLTVLSGLYGLVTGDASTAWSLMGSWATAMSWVMIATTLGLQYLAIRDGDRPER